MLITCPPPCGDHFGCDDAGDVEQSLDVRVDHGVPVGRGALVDVFESGGQPGVVEQQIDPIERFEVFPAFGFAAYVKQSVRQLPPCASMADLSAASRSARRPVAMMSYPRAASRSAVACPMPEVAPVIKACFS